MEDQAIYLSEISSHQKKLAHKIQDDDAIMSVVMIMLTRATMMITDEDDHHDCSGDSVDYVTCGHLECICGDAISGYQTLVYVHLDSKINC